MRESAGWALNNEEENWGNLGEEPCDKVDDMAGGEKGEMKEQKWQWTRPSDWQWCYY